MAEVIIPHEAKAVSTKIFSGKITQSIRGIFIEFTQILQSSQNNLSPKSKNELHICYCTFPHAL